MICVVMRGEMHQKERERELGNERQGEASSYKRNGHNKMVEVNGRKHMEWYHQKKKEKEVKQGIYNNQ